MKSKNFASICTGTSNAFRRRAGTRSVGTPQVAMCVRPRTRRPFANAYGLIGPQAGQTINNNRVALSTTFTQGGVTRTVGAIDLEANAFFSEIPPEVVDEAGSPVTITETAQALPQMNGSATITNWYAGNQYKVEQFKTADNKTLLSSQVDALVSAMAAFSPPPPGQTTLTPAQQSALSPVIAANWT